MHRRDHSIKKLFRISLLGTFYYASSRFLLIELEIKMTEDITTIEMQDRLLERPLIETTYATAKVNHVFFL